MSMSPRTRRARWAAFALLASAFVTACGDKKAPTEDDHSEHVQVNEVFLRTSANVLISRTRMIDNVWQPATITLRRGETMDARVVYLDFDNDEFTLDGDAHHQTRGSMDGAAARWTAVGAHGRIEATQVGSSRLRIQVWHEDHSDFTSPYLTVQVTEP